MRVAALATEAVLSPAIGAYLGLEIDRRAGWAPWGLVVGLLLGGGAAFQLLLWMGKRVEKSEREGE
jgi:F0F1-type ATP synthase assembly protein I